MTVPLGLWIVGDARELASYGVVGDTRRRRMAHVGQSRAISHRWARAFGCWGRVRPVMEIAELVDAEPEVVRNHAKAFDLKFATRRERRTQAELALALYCDRAAPAAQSCRRFGVLAAERVVFCLRVQELLQAQGLDVREVLSWTARRWNACWDEARPVVDIDGLCHPEPTSSEPTVDGLDDITDADAAALLARLARRRAERAA